MGPDTEKNIQAIKTRVSAGEEALRLVKEQVSEIADKFKEHVDIEEKALAAYFSTKRTKSKNMYRSE